MKDILRPLLELTVVFPGLLLAYFPVRSYLKQPPARLAAQTASAIVPDFQREVCNVLTYRRLAASVITSRGSAVGLLKQ